MKKKTQEATLHKTHLFCCRATAFLIFDFVKTDDEPFGLHAKKIRTHKVAWVHASKRAIEKEKKQATVKLYCRMFSVT